jgi:hypothetical protein
LIGVGRVGRSRFAVQGGHTSAAPLIASRLAQASHGATRTESRPVGCRYCARLGLRRLQWLGRLLRLRRFRRGHRWCRRGIRRGHRGCRRGIRRGHRGCRRGLRGLRRLRRGHRWCLRGFGGVTPKCLGGLRPGCDHGRPATVVLRLTPRPMRNAGPGMTLARGSLLGPAAAILLRRCAGQRGGRVKRREPGRRVRGIAAGTEREPGQLLRGIAGAGAGEQPNQDCQPANCERHDPRDPHGYQAGHPGLRRALHDDLSVVAISHFGGGGLLPRGGADGYPSRGSAQ